MSSSKDEFSGGSLIFLRNSSNGSETGFKRLEIILMALIVVAVLALGALVLVGNGRVDRGIPTNITDNSTKQPPVDTSALGCGDEICDTLGGETSESCPLDCAAWSQNTLLNTPLYLNNCIYNKSSDYVYCKTNCLFDADGNATISIIDSSTNFAVARMKINSTPMGYVSFTGEGIYLRPVHIEASGSVISYNLTELTADSSKWTIYLSCYAPKGSIFTSGAAKV